MEGRKHFSDFAKTEGLDGDKLTVGDILNKEIYVKAYRVMPSKCVKDRNLLQLQFGLDDRTYIIFTNSIVLIRQIEEYKSEIPFYATIKKHGSYYTFT